MHLALERSRPKFDARLVSCRPGSSSVGCPPGSTSTYPRCPLLWRLLSNSVARALLNSAPSHSASVALRTCSPEHFSKQPRMEIQNEVRVGDTDTAKPGPVQPLLLVTRLFLRHTMAVSPALTSSFGWDLWRAIAAACTARVIGSLEVSVRVRGQQLTICGIVTQQAVGQTQTGPKDMLMCRETRPIATTVSRVTTLGHCRFELRLTLDAALFIQDPQLVLE